jgi:hypothetical protein
VGDILKDHYVIGVIGALELSAVLNTRGTAATLMSIVAGRPRGIVLDLEADLTFSVVCVGLFISIPPNMCGVLPECHSFNQHTAAKP